MTDNERIDELKNVTRKAQAVIDKQTALINDLWTLFSNSNRPLQYFAPVHQTKFDILHSNCFAACIATLIGKPLSFFEGVDETIGPEWAWNMSKRVHEAGFAMLLCKDMPGQPILSYIDGMYHIISGLSPRGDLHAVVVKAVNAGQTTLLDIVHDPHPDGGGLRSVNMHTFIIPLARTSIQVQT